jgi:predicted small lipoprotein YifL
LYGAARIGDFVVTSKYRPAGRGWAILLLSAAVLALGGCGRKGMLDLPPNASAQATAAAQADADHGPAAGKPGVSNPSDGTDAPPADADVDEAGKPSVFNPYYGTDAPPAATRGRKKPFALDPLLND